MASRVDGRAGTRSALAGLAVTAMAALAPTALAALNSEELARLAQDPVTNLIFVTFQSNTTLRGNTHWIQRLSLKERT